MGRAPVGRRPSPLRKPLPYGRGSDRHHSTGDGDTREGAEHAKKSAAPLNAFAPSRDHTQASNAGAARASCAEKQQILQVKYWLYQFFTRRTQPKGNSTKSIDR